MRRREFVAALSGAAVVPLVARAQERVRDRRPPWWPEAVEIPDRLAEQRIAPEPVDERRRVGLEREHEPQEHERLLVRRA